MADTPKLTRNTDTLIWEGSETLDAQSKTYTFATEGKFVDKNIKFTAKARDGALSISGGGITINAPTVSSGSGYLSTTTTYPVKISVSGSRAAVNATVGTAGWLDSNDNKTSAAVSGSNSATFYIKPGSAAVTGTTITATPSISVSGGKVSVTNSGSGTVNGSVSTAGWITSVSGATVKASGSGSLDLTTLTTNPLLAANIVKGKNVLGVTGTGANDATITFANALATGETEDSYTDISESAPVLVSGGFLYMKEGRLNQNSKISLKQLVPDGSNIAGKAAYIYKGYSAYDNDGVLVAGTMGDASSKVSSVTVSIGSVGSTYDSTNKGYPITASASASCTASGTGYVTDGKAGTGGSGSKTAYLAAGGCTVSGGGLTAGAGSSSITSSLLHVSSGTTTEKIDMLSAAPSSGDYYEVKTTGKGTVNRAAVTRTHTTGWVVAGTATPIAAGSLSSNSGTATYYVKKSTGATQTVNPGSSAKTVTIGAGYYPSDRTITIGATSAGTQGAYSAGGSISSISATKGTITVDTTNNTASVALSLSASGTGTASVTTAGYLATGSKSTNLSKTATGSISLTLFDGSYTVA